MANIFVTGASGFLGWNIVKELLKDEGNRLFLLVRNSKAKTSQTRIDDLLAQDYTSKIRRKLQSRITVIPGDIVEANLGLSVAYRKQIVSQIDTIYHCAALCEFTVPLETIRKVNVAGTKNVLEFALECIRHISFKDVNYISTIGVAGNFSGVFYEDDLNVGQTFNNTYEQTKFEAEELISSYRNRGLAVSVFRPAIITGNSLTGETSSFHMLYEPLHIFSLELFTEIPVNKKKRYSLVPVECTAKAISFISSQHDRMKNKTYHLTNSNTIPFSFLLDTASRFFKFTPPEIISPEKFSFDNLIGFKKKLLAPYLPYFLQDEVIFDAINFVKATHRMGFSWPKPDEKFLLTLFKYCDKVGFIKRKRK